MRVSVVLIWLALLASTCLLARAAPPSTVRNFLQKAAQSEESSVKDAASVLLQRLQEGKLGEATEDTGHDGEHVLPDSRSSEPALAIRPIHRVGDIGYDQFMKIFGGVDVSVPVVIEGSMPELDPAQWTREALAAECGHVDIFLPGFREKCLNPSADAKEEDPENCHQVREVNESLIGEEWSGLQATNVSALGINTLGDLIRVQDEHPNGTKLYLHDAPLSHYCPPAAKRLKVTKYFPRDLMLFKHDKPNWDIDEPLKYGESGAPNWPSIFIGKKGSGSPLHSDAHASRFYQITLSGKKLWRLAPPSENWRLAPQSLELYNYPTLFEANLFEPDFEEMPNMTGALVYEAVLMPGEIIYVPEKWAHTVLNLEDAVSTSLNFVDDESVKGYVEDLRNSDEDDADELADAFEERYRLVSRIGLDHPGGVDKQNFDWETFFKYHAFETMPVPRRLMGDADWPEGEDMPSMLRAAVQLNWVSLVEHLLTFGVKPADAVEQGQESLKDMAGRLGHEKVEALLALQWTPAEPGADAELHIKTAEEQLGGDADMTAALAGGSSSDGDDDDDDDEDSIISVVSKEMELDSKRTPRIPDSPPDEAPDTTPDSHPHPQSPTEPVPKEEL